MTKYGAKKTIIDNIRFDSAAEARYYNELKIRKRGTGRQSNISYMHHAKRS